jgi:hypothetical protein
MKTWLTWTPKTFVLWGFGLCFGLIVAAETKAQTWIDDNMLLRQIVFATCGTPDEATGRCFCEDLLAYRLGAAAGLVAQCNGKTVPNIAHPQMSSERMMRFLITAYYGQSTDEFCKDVAEDGSCINRVGINGIGGARDEAYFAGHFTGALLGETNCLAASEGKDPDEWASGPAIGSMELEPLSDNAALLSAFQQGCRTDFRDVLSWMATR